MSIILAFFCGICLCTLSDSVADYINAKAQMIKAQAEALGIQSKLTEWKAEKGENNEQQDAENEPVMREGAVLEQD